MSRALRISNASFIGKVVCFFYERSLKVFIIISLFLLIASKTNSDFNDSVRSFTIKSITPVIYLMLSPTIAVQNGYHYFIDFFHVRKENLYLKELNDKLRLELLDNLQVAEENNILRNLLHFEDNDETSYITSRIIFGTSGAFTSKAIINLGSDDGIKKGQAIVASKGIAGRVLFVGNRNSTILLYNDLQSKIPVYSVVSRERAIMFGRNKDLPILKYLRMNHELYEGEILYTSGDGVVYPADIPVGVVHKEENGDFVVLPFVDLHKLEFIRIINQI